MLIGGLRQGDAPATVYFNILVARVYRKQLTTLDVCGVLFAVANDLRGLDPPRVIEEIAEVLPKVAWEEAGLTTKTTKNKIFVQPSARNGWRRFLESTPPETLLSSSRCTASRTEAPCGTTRIWTATAIGMMTTASTSSASPSAHRLSFSLTCSERGSST